MLFELVSKKVVVNKGTDKEKLFTNFYLKSTENGYLLPIEIKKIVVDEEIVNKNDYIFALRIAKEVK